MPGYCTAYQIMRPESIRCKREVAASMPQRRYPSPPTSPLPQQPPPQPAQQPAAPPVNHLPTSHDEDAPSAHPPQTDQSLPLTLPQTNVTPMDPLKHNPSAENRVASKDSEKHEQEEGDGFEPENKAHNDSNEEQDLPLPPLHPQSSACPADFAQSVLPPPHLPQLELIGTMSTASDPSDVPKPTNHKRRASELDHGGFGGSQPKKRRHYTTVTTDEKLKGRRIRSMSSTCMSDHSQSSAGRAIEGQIPVPSQGDLKRTQQDAVAKLVKQRGIQLGHSEDVENLVGE